MSDNKDIKKSLKATSIFGGVQIFTIIINIIRTKLVAILIGPAGVGLVSLYTSTINLITSSTNFSLSTSAVRDISLAYNSGDEEKFRRSVSLFSKIVWFTGLLGALVCAIGSPLWSKLTFGSYDYTIGFVLLSVVLLLSQLQSGKGVLLQSTARFKYMAYSSIIGSVFGLITTIPIYYFWGVDGIVAILILSSISSFLLAYFFASKLKIKYISIPLFEAVKEGRNMLKQGFLLSVNFLLSTLIFYVLRVFISHNGGVAELGLYASSFTIVTTYVGMVFSSMAQEYYPRISALSLEKDKFNDAINNQIYFCLLLLGPMICCFLVFSEQILTLLYSEKFNGASMLMALSMLGVTFQAPSWCMGFAFLAKSDNKAFLIYETIAKIQKLITDIFAYLEWGLTGLGISFIISYIYYTVQCAVVCNRRYGLKINNSSYLLLLVYFIFGSLLLCSVSFSFSYHILFCIFVIIISCTFSYMQLNKIVDMNSFIKSKLFRNG